MSTITKFNLFLEDELMGSLSFNGEFIFEIAPNIDIPLWKKFGIIPIDEETGKCVSDDLFLYVNSRLPILLRDAPKEKKIQYIKDTELKVASDEYRFVLVN